MSKKINIILLSVAGGLAALGYIIQNVKSGAAGAIIFTIAFITLMAYKPTRTIIAQLLAALVNLFSTLADNADKTSNHGSNSNGAKSSIKKYYCKYCGIKFDRMTALTSQRCYKHPLGSGKGFHLLYQGSEKPKYLCIHCGQPFGSLTSLTSGICYKNLQAQGHNGYHVPVEDWP